MERSTHGGVERPNLSPLRWAGVALPIAAVMLAETFRYIASPEPHHPLDHVLWTALAIMGIIAFALAMFWWIDRAEREVVRQNRELGALNAVSRAVQDPDASRDVIHAALQSIVATTYASRATVRIFPADGEPAPEPVSFPADEPTPPSGALPLELPMATDTAVIGLLQVWPAAEHTGHAAANGLSTAALQNISHQLGCAIEHQRLVAHLQRRDREITALYDVAVAVSAQLSLADTLARVGRSARDLLVADEASICLTRATSESVVTRAPESSGGQLLPVASDGSVCIIPDGGGPLRHPPDHRGVCPARLTEGLRHVLPVAIRSADTTLGDIWVGRRLDRPFDAGDRALLTGLADLASIAITSAQLRERDRLSATVAERERIARELHDSLAQVLGVTHLRLRAIGSEPAILDAPTVSAELSSLADLAEDAFHDVREAILGLREASNLHRGFVESLSAYLEKFGMQAGIPVELDTNGTAGPELTPASQIQVIRVIQEALANVRKHAGAARATVRLADDASGTTIEVEDDGRGFDAVRLHSNGEGGFGLQTMRERMELVGGSLTVDSSPGRGTRVTARLPTVHSAPGAPRPRGGTDAAEAAEVAAAHPARG